jgi:hypothetical protein
MAKRADEEDVRVRQLRSLGYLHMLAQCPEDTPFTLPELQKRSQQEASKRREGHTPSPSTTHRQHQHQQQQRPASRDDDDNQHGRRRRRRRRDREDDDLKERRSATAAMSETIKTTRAADLAPEQTIPEGLAFLEVDVRVSQAKAMARLTHSTPSTPTRARSL